jgi:hypothetical protein
LTKVIDNAAAQAQALATRVFIFHNVSHTLPYGAKTEQDITQESTIITGLWNNYKGGIIVSISVQAGYVNKRTIIRNR